MWQMAIGVLEENKAANRGRECWTGCNFTCGGQGCLTEMLTVRNWGEASEKDLTLTGGHSKCKSPNCKACCWWWCVSLGRILYVSGDVSVLVRVLNKCTQMPSLKSILSASFLQSACLRGLSTTDKQVYFILRWLHRIPRRVCAVCS